MVFICFPSVFRPTRTALYHTFVVGPSTGVREKFPETLSLWGRWPTYSTKARYGSLSPPSGFHILVLYFRAHFLELILRHLGRSLYSTYSSLTVKSSMWHSYCSLYALIPKWVALFHQTRRRSEPGFCKPMAPEDHICSIWWSSNGSLAFCLFPTPFFFKSNSFSLRTAWQQLLQNSQCQSCQELEDTDAAENIFGDDYGTSVVSPGLYLPSFSFPVCRISTKKKCFRSCGASVLEMLFKFSSVLYFSK